VDFIEVYERFEANEPDELLKALGELEQVSIDAGKEAQKASAVYFADVEDKKAKISNRIADLTGQRAVIQGKIDALRTPLTDATIKGNREKLDEIQASLRTLEVDIAQATTEIELLEAAFIKGDDDLYNDVMGKQQCFEEIYDDYQDTREQLYHFALKRGKQFEKVADKTRAWGVWGGTRGGGNGASMSKVNDCHDAERIAKEHAICLEEEAARKAAEALRPHSAIIHRHEYHPTPDREPAQVYESGSSGPAVHIRDDRAFPWL
jgi:hypothetical protein